MREILIRRALHRSPATALALCLAMSLAGGTALALPQSDEYRIGPRDVLEVRVFDLERLNSVVTVSEGGTIQLPVIGDVEAQGHTREELETAIEETLSRFVNNPQVFVAILEYQSQRFSIIGAVAGPGPYSMTGRTTLLEAISIAGGIVSAMADGTIRILRPNVTMGPIEIEIGELLERGNVAYNIELQPGDFINVVPKQAYNIYISGQVARPGSFELQDPITLMKAISLAGGFAERAKKSSIRILRPRPDGTHETIKVNFNDIQEGRTADIELQPNDIVVVPQTFF